MSQIDELRQIIVGDNSEKLSELKQRIEDIDIRTRDVAEVLAPAIGQGISENDDLINALKEPLSASLKQAIRAEPIEYAEILYPAIAPSIRLAISQAISSLLATINQTVESATSVNGLKLRYESMRTGVPYAELVLRKSLLYRVEHIYLISRESGLLIAECATGDGETLDSDAVGAMFSAIQSFVQDSFTSSEADHLTDFKVGTHTVWIAHGPSAMLACVIIGDAPESLKTQLYECLEDIRTNYAEQLANFDGDPASFVGVQKKMQTLLQIQIKEESDLPLGSQAQTSWVNKLTGFLLVSGLIYFFAQWTDQRATLATVQYYFNKTPGLMVTKVYNEGKQIVVEGLQDPDAQLPYATLTAYNIQPEDLSLKTTPFRSLLPELEIQRFSEQLLPPRGVILELKNHIITLHGQAPIAWLLDNNVRLLQLSADKRLDISSLRASESSVRVFLSSKLRSLDTDSAESLMKILSNQPWAKSSAEQVWQLLAYSDNPNSSKRETP